jgi:hypothetical protein
MDTLSNVAASSESEKVEEHLASYSPSLDLNYDSEMDAYDAFFFSSNKTLNEISTQVFTNYEVKEKSSLKKSSDSEFNKEHKESNSLKRKREKDLKDDAKEEESKLENIKVDSRGKICEHCQKNSSNGILKKSKFSDKKLCNACYTYINRHKILTVRDERKPGQANKNRAGCEYCQQKSMNGKYKKGFHSKKMLCAACYSFEYRTGILLPPDKRNPHEKHTTDICEFCERRDEVNHYLKKGIFSRQSLCHACYTYERKHKKLIPLNQRAFNQNKSWFKKE